jgi:flagellar biosynthetic protein FlhB
MSEAADRDERTEQPSEKRLREARERGDVPRSRELGNVAVLGSATLALLATGPHVGAVAQQWLRGALTIDPGVIGHDDRLLTQAAQLLVGLLMPLLPVVAVALAACLLSPAVMGSIRFSGQALQPDFARLNPMAGIARLYGRDGVAELVRSLLRVLLVGGSGAWVVHGAFRHLLALPEMDLATAIGDGVHAVIVALLAMVGALGLLAAIDVPWQRFQHRSRLKMTKQEVRDEHKESEGNPEIKARVRHVAKQLSQRRMMEAVPTADVVITNPTHYAVALKYEAGRMRAPRLVAKGVDEMALAIRDVAGKHRVSIIESPPLARALYRHAQIDREIPVNLYAAVAQVLSYVYQLKRWVPSRGPMPTLAEVVVDPALADPAPDAATHGDAP